jgi:hypothetical protein
MQVDSICMRDGARVSDLIWRKHAGEQNEANLVEVGDEALVIADRLAGKNMHVGFPLVLGVLRPVNAVFLPLLGTKGALGVTVLTQTVTGEDEVSRLPRPQAQTTVIVPRRRRIGRLECCRAGPRRRRSFRSGGRPRFRAPHLQ